MEQKNELYYNIVPVVQQRLVELKVSRGRCAVSAPSSGGTFRLPVTERVSDEPLKPELLEAMKPDSAKFLCSLSSLEWGEPLAPDVKNEGKVLRLGCTYNMYQHKNIKYITSDTLTPLGKG